MGRGGAGFPLPYQALIRGQGVYFSGNPHPAPFRGPPAFIPYTGPCWLPPILNSGLSGVWAGQGPERGLGQEMPKKTPRPRPLSGVGRGRGPGASVFRGPVRPVTNSTVVSLSDLGDRGLIARHSTQDRLSPLKEIPTHQTWSQPFRLTTNGTNILSSSFSIHLLLRMIFPFNRTCSAFFALWWLTSVSVTYSGEDCRFYRAISFVLLVPVVNILRSLAMSLPNPSPRAHSLGVSLDYRTPFRTLVSHL